MIIGVAESTRKDLMNFGTHNGIFHCDEVVGIAILEIAHMKNATRVVRTRDINELKELNIVIDVGGGVYDHHMAGFDVRRPTGEKYASAGLVWRDFGEKAIKNVMIVEGVSSIDDDEIKAIKEDIDREVIIPIDAEDNGEKVNPLTGELIQKNYQFSFVSKFLPSWMETPDYDDAFYEVETIVCDIMMQIIKDKILQVAAKKELQKRYDYIEDDGILEIPSQTMPWLEEVVTYNETHDYRAKFVIFPYPAGGWAAQSVPPSIEKKFDQLVSFPKEWAGGNEKTLPEISGIKDATFCHNGRFFVRAKTKESIIEMCREAVKNTN